MSTTETRPAVDDRPRFEGAWETKQLGDEFNASLGKMIDAAKNWGIAKPYVGNRALQWGRVDIDELGEGLFSPTDIRAYRLEKNDLLVCEGGEVGRCAIWRDDLLECYFQKAVHRLRPRGAYSVELLRYLFEYWSITNALEPFVTQTSIAHLPKDKIVELPLPLPPLPEQRAIAAALSDVDDLLQSLDRLIAKKRDVKQGAMQQLLTGTTRLPGFEGAWERTTVAQSVSTPVTDGPHSTPDFLDDGVPFLSVNNVVENKLDFTDLRYISPSDDADFARKCKPVRDDVLMGKAATVGTVAIVDTDLDFNIWSPLALLRFGPSFIPRFAYYTLLSDQVINQIRLLTNSSSQGNLGMGDISKLILPLPPLPEQRAIAAALSDMDAEIDALEARRDKAAAIKQGMMQELLTGRTRLPIPQEVES